MSKLYDLLSAMCGKIKKPDWNQNDPTAPDYVKNRPFYTGNLVKSTLVEESTVSFSEYYGIYYATFQSTFTPTVGDTYTVLWDGSTYECTCEDVNDTLAIGNLSIAGGSDTGEPFIITVSDFEGNVIYTKDTSASHTFSISGFAREVVKIDKKYLPDTVATKSEVEAAQNAANNAQNAANNAQNAADNAQNAANSSKEALYGVLVPYVTFTFDKQTSGRDTFMFNAYNYYKISDFNPAPEDVVSFAGTRETGEEVSGITVGNNCVEYGFFIVVASAGDCSIKISERPIAFTAPSAGLYACYEKDNQFMTAGTGEFTLRSSTGSLSITGLLLKSSTQNSTKKFRITVDDSGKPTFTNSSDSADSYTPTDLPSVTTSDSGKFLRVINGEAAWSIVPNAEEANF